MSDFAGLVIGDSCLDNDFVSPSWLSQQLDVNVSSAELLPLSGAGGLAAAMNRITVTLDDGSTRSFILKRTPTEGEVQAKALGQPREAFFFVHNFGSQIGIEQNLPVVRYAHGNMGTGKKTLLMAELNNHVQSGYFFGPHSPHNWGKNLLNLTGIDEGDRIAIMEKVTSIAFRISAKMNAKFWKDSSLLAHMWLRGVEYVAGTSEASWTAAQDTCVKHWSNTKKKIEDGTSAVRWSPHLVACMDASIAKISWENFRANFVAQGGVFTLVHGDFHPANMMVRKRTPEEGGLLSLEDTDLTILDWEVVGLGSGPQDCAQYFISHMVSADRRQCEERLLKEYYATLVANGVEEVAYGWERCWADYVEGGVCRWVWLLALLSAICPDPLTQYFHDQVSDFILDHGITPENIAMPRV